MTAMVQIVDFFIKQLLRIGCKDTTFTDTKKPKALIISVNFNDIN